MTVIGPARRPGICELRVGEAARAGADRRWPDADRRGRARADRARGPSRAARRTEGAGPRGIDVSLGGLMRDPANDISLEDGDRLSIFEVGDRLANVVTIRGASVLRPGTFQHRPGMMLRDRRARRAASARRLPRARADHANRRRPHALGAARSPWPRVGGRSAGERGARAARRGDGALPVGHGRSAAGQDPRHGAARRRVRAARRHDACRPVVPGRRLTEDALERAGRDRPRDSAEPRRAAPTP